MGQVLILVLIVVSIKIFIANCTRLEFNRERTGVIFEPYVKNTVGEQPIPGKHSYTLEDIKTMLEVVSTKFSRIATTTVDSFQVPYVRNQSYYEGAYIQARTAEAAALINQERGNKSLSVIVGIWLTWENSTRLDTEMNVAVEAAQKANSIYPGTVDGFMFAHQNFKFPPPPLKVFDVIERLQNTTNWIRRLRNITSGHIKIGSRQRCKSFMHTAPEDGELGMLKKEVILESDFIMCDFIPFYKSEAVYGPKHVFKEFRRDLLNFRSKIHEIKESIQVLGTTYWPAGGDIEKPWLNKITLRDYWKEMNEFATEYSFPLYLKSAFDNPCRKSESKWFAHLGWWRLVSNNLIQNVSGYVEKIYEPESPKLTFTQHNSPTTSTELNEKNNWFYTVSGVAVLATVAVAGFMAAFLCILYKRYKRMQSAFLTKEDIREFMYGLEEEQNNGKDFVNCAALIKPYDKSLEISLDELEILRDQVLGEGEFGCVYKALIRKDEVMEVAVKTTKRHSPSTATKSLLTEIKILSYLGNHANIVSLHGAYTKEIANNVVYLATELCPLGSLQGYLRSCNCETQEVIWQISHECTLTERASNDRKSNTKREGSEQQYCYLNTIELCENIPFQDLVRWSHEIACGMEYMEQMNIIHADLATRNVLLSSDATAKITDFGLSRRLYDFAVYNKRTMEPLPWRWMALESLKRMEFSIKSDVWSYGVVLWEIFSLGDLPFPGQSWNDDFVESLENGLKPKQPIFATDEIYLKMRECWRVCAADRPSFSDLKKWTKELNKNVARK